MEDAESEERYDRWAELRELGESERILEECDEILAADAGDDDAAFMRTLALGDLGRWRESLAGLDELARLHPEEAQVQEAISDVAFASCRFELAREAALAALRLDPDSAAGHEVLALVAERAGEIEEADRHQAEAHRLDPQGYAAPLHLDDATFARVIEESIAELPEAFRKLLDEVPIIEEMVPSEALLRSMGSEADPLLLGLYQPTDAVDDSLFRPDRGPACIYLFRRNIERVGDSEDAIREEIAVTLYHELGHHLGYDEDGVADLGLA